MSVMLDVKRMFGFMKRSGGTIQSDVEELIAKI